MTTRIENRWILGIDPGNESSGVALLRPDGTLVVSATVDPWAPAWEAPFLEPILSWAPWPGPFEVTLEVPQNGTHASRGGVQRAGGLLVGRLISATEGRIRRSSLFPTTPSAWRKALGLPTKGAGKDVYVAAARERFGVSFRSHDEAEACLIAYARLLRRGGPVVRVAP